MSSPCTLTISTPALLQLEQILTAYLCEVGFHYRHRLDTSITESVNNTIKIIKHRAQDY